METGIRLLNKENYVAINHIINELVKPEIHSLLFDDNWGKTEIALLLFNPTTVVYAIMEEGRDYPVGVVYFSDTVPYRDCVLGAVIFDPKDRDEGRMTDIIKAIADDMRKRYRVHSGSSYVIGDNEGSKKFLERLGFKKVGIKEKVVFAGGRYQDLTLYYRLADEEEV